MTTELRTMTLAQLRETLATLDPHDPHSPEAESIRAQIATLDAGDGAEWAPLVDVSAVPIGELIEGGNDAIARSVRRLVRSLDDPNGVISAFSSFVE